MRRVLRERFVKTAELSLFALTTGMPRRDAARIFYQVCGALLALTYPVMRHPTRLCVQPLYMLWEPLPTPHFVLRCPVHYSASALLVSLTKPCQAACLLSRVESLLWPSDLTCSGLAIVGTTT